MPIEKIITEHNGCPQKLAQDRFFLTEVLCYIYSKHRDNMLLLNKIIVGFILLGVVPGCTYMIEKVHASDSQNVSTAIHAKISLDNVKMNVVKTAENGVVNHETIFLFSQKDDVITAEYAGGKIRKGFLVGRFTNQNQLTFSYCQMQNDGALDNGASTCEVAKNENGKITLTEHFEWKSRPGEFGTNVFQEL